MRDVLILALIELIGTFIFFGVLVVLKKMKVPKNVGWFFIALMVLVLNGVGEHLGYDSVTRGAAGFLQLMVLVPGYFIISSYIDSDKNKDLDNENKPNSSKS
jgi:hypothetical protein